MQSHGRMLPRSGSCVRETRHAASHAQVQRHPVVCRNWRAFGPSSEHNDGDSEFYQTASRLTAQYPQWFPNQHQDELTDEETPLLDRGLVRDQHMRPEFGLSAKQIQALNLGGMQSRLPDPVRRSFR